MHLHKTNSTDECLSCLPSSHMCNRDPVIRKQSQNRKTCCLPFSLLLIYIVTLSKSLLCSSSAVEEGCSDLIEHLKICGTKALYKPLLLLFLMKLRKINGIQFICYIWKSELQVNIFLAASHFVFSECSSLTGQLLKMSSSQ